MQKSHLQKKLAASQAAANKNGNTLKKLQPIGVV